MKKPLSLRSKIMVCFLISNFCFDSHLSQVMPSCRGLSPLQKRRRSLPGSVDCCLGQCGREPWVIHTFRISGWGRRMEQVTKDKLGFLSPTHIQGNSCPAGQEHCTSIPAYKAHTTGLLAHTSAAMDQVGTVSHGDAFTPWLTCLPSPWGMSTLASPWYWDTNRVLPPLLPEGS